MRASWRRQNLKQMFYLHFWVSVVKFCNLIILLHNFWREEVPIHRAVLLRMVDRTVHSVVTGRVCGWGTYSTYYRGSRCFECQSGGTPLNYYNLKIFVIFLFCSTMFMFYLCLCKILLKGMLKNQTTKQYTFN